MTDRLRELADRPTDRTAIEWLSDRIEAMLLRGERHFQLEGAELDLVIDAIRRRPHDENERLREALKVAQKYLPHVRPEAPAEGLMAAQRLICEALEQGGSQQ